MFAANKQRKFLLAYVAPCAINQSSKLFPSFSHNGFNWYQKSTANINLNRNVRTTTIMYNRVITQQAEPPKHEKFNNCSAKLLEREKLKPKKTYTPNEIAQQRNTRTQGMSERERLQKADRNNHCSRIPNGQRSLRTPKHHISHRRPNITHQQSPAQNGRT